ncbi:kelch domain-containing protein [Anaeramoeba ignava]|uniref:Kelch domain-containing protein n=1 Tax=Anaeramoeba ignava TaxID=1746090 RepID=A0A9Q0L6Q0_ANAIG|nr:kelch domain-containing protein [Anaeramoeba ignava]
MLEWINIKSSSKTYPSKRYGQSITLCETEDGKKFCLLFGGKCSEIRHNDLWELNIYTKKWKKIEIKGSKPAGRTGQTAFFYKNQFYIFGGSSRLNRDMNDMWRLDIKKQIWEEIKYNGKIIPEFRCYHSSVVYDNKLWVLGGIGRNDEILKSFLKFDLETFVWEYVHSIVGRIFRHTASVISDSMYIIGGSDGNNDNIKDIFIFSFQNQSWSKPKLDYIPPLVCGHSAITFDNQVCIFNGMLESGDFTREMWVFNPLSYWHQLKTNGVEYPWRFSDSSFYFAGKIYMFGGGYQANSEPDWHYHSDFLEILVDPIDNMSSFSQDMKNLLFSQNFASKSFKCIDGEIFVHDLIMKCRLKEKWNPLLFSLQFSGNEKKEVMDFLLWVYTGGILDLKLPLEQILQIKNIAEKLRIDSLLDQIEKFEKTGEFELVEKNLEELLNEESTKDFYLIVENQKIAIHKLILGSRTELFRGMFLSVQDSKHEVHDLSGRSYEAIQVLIHFLYTNQLSNLTMKIALELIDANQYYGLNSSFFQDSIVHFIHKNLSIENVKDVIKNISGLEILSLENKIMDFVIKNEWKFLNDDNSFYKMFKLNNPDFEEKKQKNEQDILLFAYETFTD